MLRLSTIAMLAASFFATDARAHSPLRCDSDLETLIEPDPFAIALEVGRAAAHAEALYRVRRGHPSVMAFEPALVRPERAAGEPLNVSESAGQCGIASNAIEKHFLGLASKRYVPMWKNLDNDLAVARDLDGPRPNRPAGALDHAQAFVWDTVTGTVVVVDATFAQVPHMPDWAPTVQRLKAALPAVYDALAKGGMARLSKSEFASYWKIVQGRSSAVDLKHTLLEEPDAFVASFFHLPKEPR